MVELSVHFGAVDKSSLFDALERAATRVGLALFVVHVSADPPIVLYGNSFLAELVGRPLDELVGRPPWELVAPTQQARVRDIIASRPPGAPPIALDFEIERPDGSLRKIEVGVARITTAAAELSVCYFRDTTNAHAAADALRRSEAGFRSLIENAPDAVVILQQGRIVLANAAAVRMFGEADFEAVRGRLLADYLPPGEAERARQRIAALYQGAAVHSSEYHLKNGVVGEVHSVLYEYEGRPAILTFVRDVRERRAMHEQLFRADRLAVLGTMAATVAHEINNPLTYLQLSLQRLDREATNEPDPARAAMLREHIANSLHGVERVARIVRDLRAYSRDQPDEQHAAVDVIAVVERALQMVEHDLRHRAQLIRRYPTEPAIVDGSAARLEQVVINLLVNAIQALDAARQNTITIEITAGDQVTLAISDTGPGLTEPERIFDPFFTTKPVEGTGLGLSVCKQLVERMHGKIEIAHTSAQGTTFVVALPRRVLPAPPAIATAPPIRGARLRILVIDDEPQVCKVLGGLLGADHDVDTADNGELALTKLATTRFDAILCDVMMPRMNGRDVYDQIRTRWPGLERRVVFITGGAFVPALAAFLESVDNPKLRKPFSIEHVLALVVQVTTQ